MPVTIDTTTSTLGVAYGSQRRLAACANGVRWMAHYSGSNIELWYSTNNGTAWSQDTTGGNLVGTNVALFIDRDDYAHAVTVSSSQILYYRGTPNTARTSWTWNAATVVHNASGNNYPTVVAHRSGTGWKTHVAWGRAFTSSYGHTEYRCVCSGGIGDVQPFDCSPCYEHTETWYTSWGLSANCVCGGDCGWFTAWHTVGCPTCLHVHRCSSASQQSRFIDEGSTTDNYMMYGRLAISAAGDITTEQSPMVVGGSYGVNVGGYPCLDFNHVGDGVTIKDSAPHLYLAWSAGTTGTGKGIRYRRAAYTAGVWTWGTATDILTTEYISGSYISGLFDGTRFVCAYVPSGSTSTIKIFERDAGNTTTTWRTPTALSDGTVTALALTHISDNIYLYAVGTTSDDVKLLIFDRETASWDATWTTIEATDAVAGNLSAKRGIRSGTSPPATEIVYLTGTGSPYTIRFNSIVTNTPPTAPLWESPASGSVQDVAESLTLDWVFQDPQPSDTQSAYTVRKREGSAAYEYWDGSTWVASESGATKITSTQTFLNLVASWGADGDDDHYYSVKTWDSSDAGPSEWSTELRVVPSAQDNPTITTITTIGTSTYNVTWTAATQTKYRLRVYGDDSGIDYDDLHYDSGIVISSIQEHVTPFPTNSITVWVSLYTYNDEGLISDEDTEDGSVSYTPPPTPTLVVYPYEISAGVEAGLAVDITNPSGSPQVSYNDLYRRVVGETGNGIRVAAELATNTIFVDWAVGSGIDYEYLCRAWATSTNVSADSVWQSGHGAGFRYASMDAGVASDLATTGTVT